MIIFAKENLIWLYAVKLQCVICIRTGYPANTQFYISELDSLECSALNFNRSESTHGTSTGQVFPFQFANGTPRDFIAPQTMYVSVVVKELQSGNLASANACSGVKMQKYQESANSLFTSSYSRYSLSKLYSLRIRSHSFFVKRLRV